MSSEEWHRCFEADLRGIGWLPLHDECATWLRRELPVEIERQKARIEAADDVMAVLKDIGRACRAECPHLPVAVGPHVDAYWTAVAIRAALGHDAETAPFEIESRQPGAPMRTYFK